MLKSGMADAGLILMAVAWMIAGLTYCWIWWVAVGDLVDGRA